MTGRESAGQVSATPLGAAASSRERSRVLVLAGLIVAAVSAYLVLPSTETSTAALMPYQTLARELVPVDQAMFNELKGRILRLEAARAQTGQWPDPGGTAVLPDTPPPVAGAHETMYTWQRSTKDIIVNYLGRPPQGESSAAWLVVYREPDPSVPVDTAPNDEEHHRLPDGTVLHVSIWMRRFGGQVGTEFFPRPELAGWTQVLTAPLDRRAPPFGPPPPSK